MRLDFLKLCVVLSLMMTGSVWAASQKSEPKPAPKPAAKPAPKPTPAPKPVTHTVVKTVIVPRATTRRPTPRNNNQLQNQVVQVIVNTDYHMTFADKGKVRLLDSPIEFDDKGTRKQLTAEDLKKYKGDTPAEQKLEGYKGDFSDVRVGDSVKVYLSTFKPNPKKNTAAKKEADEETKKPEKKEADKEEAKDPEKETSPGKKASANDEEETEDGRWVTNTILDGKITKLDKPTGGSLKFTIRVVTAEQQTIQARTNNNNNITNNNNNNIQNPAPQSRTVEVAPDQKQATKVVIARRPAKDATPVAADKAVN